VEKYYKFTFIIPYKHKPDRLINLRRVIEWVSNFSGVEIILVEQDKSPKIKNLSLKGVRYFFVKNENLPFNKSLTFNVGLKYATTDVIVFGDADIVMDPEQLINGIKLLSQYECVSPYNRVIDLKPEELSQSMGQWNQIDRPGRGETDIQKICLAGGIIIFRKDAAYKIGGWDESFIGWGAEDDYMSFKAKSLLNWYELPGKCFHLYHSPETPNMTYYPRNLQLLNKLNQMGKEELVRYINSSSNPSKIGWINKYDK